MHLSCLLLSLLPLISALAVEKRDADFYSVRTTMHQDMSGRRGDSPDKYFRAFPLLPDNIDRLAFLPRRLLTRANGPTDESMYVDQRPFFSSLDHLMC
jgi:hypothetical protein